MKLKRRTAIIGAATWTTEVIDGGHDLMVTHSNELSNALDRVARSTRGH